MADVKRPLPRSNEADTGPFWSATKAKQLRYQQCSQCQTVVFYPRAHCTGCTEGELSWQTASGKGTLYSYSVVRQSYHPYWREHVPYAIAWIDLEEGPRLLANITGVDDPISELACGMPVEVQWEEHEDVSIPLFRPA